MPEAEQEDDVRQDVDRRLIAIASLAVTSIVAWGTGLTLVLVRAAEGSPDIAVLNGVMAVASCSTLVAVILGQDLARRRRMKTQVNSVAGACSVTVTTAVADLRRDMVEAIGALAAETEQLSAKVNAAEWASWATKLYDQPAEAPAVVDINRQRGNGG